MWRERHLQLSGQGPLYRQIVVALREQAGRGELAIGDLLPSTRELADRLQIHRHTVATAFQELVAEGWIESEPGRGFRVARSPLISAQERQPRQPEPWEEVDAPPLPYRFPSGQPDLRLFPGEEYFSLMRRIVRDCDNEDLLGYSSPWGRPALRQHLTRFLASTRGLQLSPAHLVVTHGCQEAIFLLGQSLLSPGQVVAVEERGFSPVWSALARSGAELAPVPLDSQGIVPEALEDLCLRRPVKLLYLTPIHQYPTTVTLPLSRRQQIYELSLRHDFLIVEDDYDNEFHFASQPPSPMKAHDPEDRILYCGTLSKLLAPSLRLGFVVVPSALARGLAEMKRIVSRQNDTLCQETVAAWMAEGGFERHLRRMRRKYQSRRQVMLEELGLWRSRGLPWSYQSSGGGMSLWIDFARDSQQLSLEAARVGVDFRPGSAYEFTPGPSTCARLGFCQPDEEQIRQGLSRLASVCLGAGQLSQW